MPPHLPTELKIKIIKHVDRTTLPSILRVNSTFREIGEPLLYRTVILAPFISQPKDTENATTCLRTIANKPSLLSAVYHLELYLADQRWYRADSPEPSKHAVDEFFDSLRVALSKLSHVAKLKISGVDLLPAGQELPRHSPLQSLQHYSGPPETLEHIESSVLRTVQLSGASAECEPVRTALSRISHFCGRTMRVLRLYPDPSWGEQSSINLIAEIPILFPNIVTLDLELDIFLLDETVDTIGRIISKLNHLRLLRMTEDLMIRLSREERVVKRLHASCPQLRAISFGSKEPWRFSERLQEWLINRMDRVLLREGRSLPEPDIWQEAHYEQYLADPVHEGFDEVTGWRA